MLYHSFLKQRVSANASKEVCMVTRVGAYLNQLTQHFYKGMADYSHLKLTEFNGTQILRNGIWRNLKLNGQATLGDVGEPRTFFEGIVVANGKLIGVNCKFDLLDARGEFDLWDCLFKEKGIFWGFGVMKKCQAPALEFSSSGGKFAVVDSTINGDIRYSSMGHVGGELSLENTKVEGRIFTPKGDARKVKVNGPQVEIVEE